MKRKTEFEKVAEMSTGAYLYRQENGVGGHIYHSDEVGGGVFVWDTCLVSQETLETAIKVERERYEADKVATQAIDDAARSRREVEDARMEYERVRLEELRKPCDAAIGDKRVIAERVLEHKRKISGEMIERMMACTTGKVD